MELFKTEQILWEKTYSKSLLLEIKLKPWPQKVTEVVPRVVALRHEWQDNSVVAVADLCVEVYFSDYNAAINFTQHEKRVTEVFLPEKVAEGMAIYASCDLHMQDMSLSGDTLTVNLRMDFKLEGVIDREMSRIPAGAMATQKITAFQSFGSKTWMGTSHGIFQKADLRHILAIKPHVEELDDKLFHGLVLIEGSILLDIFYSDIDGLEKYDRFSIPFRESAECETAVPQRQAKADLAFTGVKHRTKSTGECEIIVAYRLEVKILEKKERAVLVELEEPGYEILKKELVLNQNVCEGTITLMLEENFGLPYPVKNIADIYGRIDSLTCHPLEKGFTAEGVLGIELYFICEEQHERCKYLEMKFRKSQLLNDMTGEEKYELSGRVLHISAYPQGKEIKIKALLEINYNGIARQQLQAITDVIPGEGVHKELFHIESCIEEKSMAFVEKFEINTDFPISHVESVKGEVASIQVTVMDSKVLIQCNISVHVFYAGPDGVLRSKKALFPFGVFEDLKEGGPEMQVKVISRISEVKTELVALQRLRIIFMLNFDLLATREEDIYLVTQVPKENGKMRQVFYEDHKFNLNFVLPLTSPLLMVKELEAVPRKAWMEKSSSGFWAVGELSVSCSYVGKNHLIHQDFERLDFRFKIPDKEEIAPNNFSVHAKARKIVSNPESDMVEVDLEVEIRTFHFAKI
ncbi:MAG: DUF3794 domain-containing protein [Tepidanaerobacteraceae bacterium]|jgi:hypothetical protein|nr:DUF3794 domain-containing protein [Tepidanaerobacteraceae bacterium]